MEQLIKQKLSEIEKQYEVQILFASETGSRAWGLPAVEQDTDLGVHTTPSFMLEFNDQLKAAQDVKILYILLKTSQLSLNSGTRKRIGFGYPNLLPQKGVKS
ncbi:nucleotidyltransferase domain-containing protein [Pontibacter sp. BT731]|uniref:DNA polymerase beta superfamily protein n=1 Tax=Pontibacter coccineus TaxID=3063328 RepID=UPI0026E2C727|nr:nucleotidyltransferase domain-containing protein [Pontibacter sp. BT731]MDO6388523.1 nucleotidyltransferase domain-containing protein [Pontibacter sp. BT731]